MKVTLNEIMDAKPAFDRVLQKAVDVKVAYRARKIVGKIVEELKHAEDLRLDLVNKYGELITVKDVRGKDVQVKQVLDAKIDAYRKELEEALEIEVDLGVQKIPYDSFIAVGQISFEDMALLDKFIEEPKEEKVDGVK